MAKAHWQRLGLTVLAGLSMATLNFSTNTGDQGSIQFIIALFLLFLALDGSGPRWGFRLGFIWGILAYGLTLSWFWTIFQGISAGLWSILAFFPAVFGSWFGTVTCDGASAPAKTPSWRNMNRGPWWVIPTAALVWTGLEYFRCEWFILRFPWITPGTIMAPTGLSPFIGTYGMTFLVILGISAATLRAKSGFPIVVILTIVIIAFQVPTRPERLPATGDAHTVALVQSEQGFFAAYKELTDTIEGPVDAIIWPEYALSYDIRKDPADMAAVRSILQRTGAKFLTVGSRTDIDDINFYNTAITIGPDSVLGTHYKNRTVHFFADGTAGETLHAIPTPIGRIATPVCFDCDYTAVSRRLVLDGTEVFLVPSMDAEHWTARQHEQHAQLFRHRAAENRRWFAVAATSGVTQIIDPTGNVIRRLPTMTEGVLTGQVATRRDLTFYTRFGWVLGPTCTLAMAGVLLGTIIAGSRRMRRPAAEL